MLVVIVYCVLLLVWFVCLFGFVAGGYCCLVVFEFVGFWVVGVLVCVVLDCLVVLGSGGVVVWFVV